ncbi:N-acetylmuramoyl-L-alanine amidase [Corallococcus praedator]|uniref:N-acetylmuramoyl-L-alanine amidase n=1 Tax=Corallococcus praedator TaxID=2316724 RepID=A0ABX9QPU2_9BACT|nr:MULTISPECIES: N-acetylmuramoyl-L-alanine amidase [Corallococcus]RKH20440.1 N-acetylmuramoyl-L-alanine amidase [Corallococcus sp. CA047B]RKH34790.1 N-acetylmuramoyl-L-alanine amidase [Corallococcus sp. CA031C]RKI15946.1 N-acetylmuramoyl-L-alanine amidase [Corallococcus praedator]
MSTFRNPFAAAAAALVLSACGPQAQPTEPTPSETETPSQPTDTAGSAQPRELDPLFAQAAQEFNVPAELLKAVSYTETRWQMVRGTEEFPGQQPAFGLMALRGADLEQGAALAGVSAEAVRTDAAANIRAGAALLSQFATEAKVERGDLGAWASVVARLSGISNVEAQAEHVHKGVYAVINEGAVALNTDGSVAATLEPVKVEAKFERPQVRAMAAGPNYAASIWRPAPSSNYGARTSGAAGDPSMIIIHTCEGSYSSCWSWLTNSASGVSAHYVVNESGSEVSQLVNEANRAFHIGATYDCSLNSSKECWLNGTQSNHFTIGIEHGGFASQTSFPAGQIDASAKLSCDIARDNAILKDSYHIVAHGKLQPATRTDPGPNWPWSSYLSKINSYCGTTTPTGQIIIDSNSANNDAAQARFELTGTWTAGTSAGYYGSGYYYAATEAISEPATFWFYLPTAQTRTVDAWWVAGTNRSSAAAFISFNAAGTNLGTATVNQQANGGQWVQLGSYSFTAGWNKVQLSRWQAAGSVVIADAVRVR